MKEISVNKPYMNFVAANVPQLRWALRIFASSCSFFSYKWGERRRPFSRGFYLTGIFSASLSASWGFWFNVGLESNMYLCTSDLPLWGWILAVIIELVADWLPYSGWEGGCEFSPSETDAEIGFQEADPWDFFLWRLCWSDTISNGSESWSEAADTGKPFI